MFILRKIEKDGGQINVSLGEYYILINAESSPDRFNKLLKEQFKTESPDDVYAIICYSPGTNFRALSKNISYYIMTEGGKTFANISHG